jgi:hypothetical protein
LLVTCNAVAFGFIPATEKYLRGVLMKRYLSWGLLLWLLTTPIHSTFAQSAKAESLRRKVSAWGTNQPVAVQLHSGEKLKGRIAEIKFDTLGLQLLAQGKIVTREVRWDEMKKVSLASQDKKARKVGAFILVGTLVAIAVAVGIALNDPNF